MHSSPFWLRTGPPPHRVSRLITNGKVPVKMFRDTLVATSVYALFRPPLTRSTTNRPAVRYWRAESTAAASLATKVAALTTIIIVTRIITHMQAYL